MSKYIRVDDVTELLNNEASRLAEEADTLSGELEGTEKPLKELEEFISELQSMKDSTWKRDALLQYKHKLDSSRSHYNEAVKRNERVTAMASQTRSLLVGIEKLPTYDYIQPQAEVEEVDDTHTKIKFYRWENKAEAHHQHITSDGFYPLGDAGRVTIEDAKRMIYNYWSRGEGIHIDLDSLVKFKVSKQLIDLLLKLPSINNRAKFNKIFYDVPEKCLITVCVKNEMLQEYVGLINEDETTEITSVEDFNKMFR